MNVSNRKYIIQLGLRSLKVNRTRNLVAVLAIALTAMLFTSLFTIAFSISDGIQQASFRQVGGYSHGGFKYLTQAQYDELKDDPRIAQAGLRRFLGMPQDRPFQKSHVELGYSDVNQAHWMFCDPVEGRLPREGTDEAATDTHVLSLLGVEPKLGATFSVTFLVDGHETTQTFTLCGWWPYDEAANANHILLPESRVDAVLQQVGVTLPADDEITGSWNLDVMLKSGSRHIASDLSQILAQHGYQNEDPAQADFIRTGVNWAYTGAQISEQADPIVLLLLGGLGLLILLTGYLIIYNVFQISVAGDIRFYGLLKTIGTTPRQLRHIIRVQALSLSLAGIPLGLLLGWLIGSVLTPVVTETLSAVTTTVSVRPLLFVGSALFTLVTVVLSCHRPGRLAASVSPIEAVRYTEGVSSGPSLHGQRRGRRTAKRVSLLSMARANLGRTKGKTAVTVLSLSLAVLLLTTTVTLGTSFDMNKYLSHFMASDFLVGSARQVNANGTRFSEETALPAAVREEIEAQGDIEQGGGIYGCSVSVQEFVTEAYFRARNSHWYTPEELDTLVSLCPRGEDGLLTDDIQLYGMEPYALEQLTVLDGDLSRLNQSDSSYIAAVYSTDDYGTPQMDSHWAKVGDVITLRYVERFQYYDPDTGAVYPEGTDLSTVSRWAMRAAEYREVTYTVAALVTVPYAFSYRYYGADAFVLGSQRFQQDSGTDSLLYYVFDTTEEDTAAMETFLRDYTETTAPELDYESRERYGAQFDTTRQMFLLLGGVLSLVVGLVGVLNFSNTMLTGIAARRRELAVLRAVGMTARQQKTMLALEGLLYTLGAVALALVLVLVTAPALRTGMTKLFWFLTYRFTLWPVLAILPVFLALGLLLPVLRCHLIRRHALEVV